MTDTVYNFPDANHYGYLHPFIAMLEVTMRATLIGPRTRSRILELALGFRASASAEEGAILDRIIAEGGELLNIPGLVGIHNVANVSPGAYYANPFRTGAPLSDASFISEPNYGGVAPLLPNGVPAAIPSTVLNSPEAVAPPPTHTPRSESGAGDPSASPAEKPGLDAGVKVGLVVLGLALVAAIAAVAFGGE